VDPYIGGLTRKVWQWVRREIHDRAIAAGYDDLSPAQANVFRNPSIDGMRPRDLADGMEITKQSVNELLGHLERLGYLTREPDPDDSRSRRIRLTARGQALEDVVRDAAADAERAAASLIGADRMRELRQTLVDLVDLLDQKVQRVAP
jgi:DNA-binding MarR family transcriptional regulator